MEDRTKNNLENTQFFRVQPEPVNGVHPTYVTNYKGARSLIMKVERDELVEEIMRSYIQCHNWSE